MMPAVIEKFCGSCGLRQDGAREVAVALEQSTYAADELNLDTFMCQLLPVSYAYCYLARIST
jgi:hypothetical protein